MYPHERSLVEKLKDKPFVLLGVNSDTKEMLPSIIKKNNITWRSWADGMGGDIAIQYNIKSWPTIFVLDYKGVIRFKNIRGKELEEAIDKLIKEADNK